MSGNILLCDDEIHILRAAEFKLKRGGHLVRTANDGQAGWEEIERQLPDLLVTDLQMPRLNGFELAERVRGDARTRDLPIIMLTAKGYELPRDETLEKFGLTALLTKPFSPRELLQLVNQTLETA